MRNISPGGIGPQVLVALVVAGCTYVAPPLPPAPRAPGPVAELRVYVESVELSWSDDECSRTRRAMRMGDALRNSLQREFVAAGLLVVSNPASAHDLTVKPELSFTYCYGDNGEIAGAAALTFKSGDGIVVYRKADASSQDAAGVHHDLASFAAAALVRPTLSDPALVSFARSRSVAASPQSSPAQETSPPLR